MTQILKALVLVFFICFTWYMLLAVAQGEFNTSKWYGGAQLVFPLGGVIAMVIGFFVLFDENGHIRKD